MRYRPSLIVPPGTKQGTLNRNITTLLAAASLGLLAFGASACGGDDGGDKAAPPSASGSSSASASPSQSPASPGAAPPGAPSSTALPSGVPAPPPPPPALQVVMIDGNGKKYGRQAVETLTAQAARQAGGNPPSNFCEDAFQKALKQGATFPAGKKAYMDACRAGVSSAS